MRARLAVLLHQEWFVCRSRQARLPISIPTQRNAAVYVRAVMDKKSAIRRATAQLRLRSKNEIESPIISMKQLILVVRRDDVPRTICRCRSAIRDAVMRGYRQCKLVIHGCSLIDYRGMRTLQREAPDYYIRFKCQRQKHGKYIIIIRMRRHSFVSKLR